MRIPLIEYSSIKQKDGSRKTVSSYEPLSITQEDFTEIIERLKLINQLKERSHNHCKNCKEKEEKGCIGCLWEQVRFHCRSMEKTLEGVLKALGKEDMVGIPDWEKEEEKVSDKESLEYFSVIYPGKSVSFIRDIKEAKWRIKNGSTK